MSAEQFLDYAEELLHEIRDTQLSAVKEAAAMVADSLANGGVLHYYDRGHCTGEILNRAGGLFAIHHIQPNVVIGGETPPLRRDEELRSWGEDEAVLDFMLDQANVKAGDVVLACSVSGGSPTIVGFAMAARRRGAKVIAVTSPTYSKAITSHHSSGKFLYQVADVVLDNRGPVGDAALEIPGIETAAVPSSGLGFVLLTWSLLAEVMRNLVDLGITPQVFKSVNLPEGPDFNARARKAYEEKGV